MVLAGVLSCAGVKVYRPRTSAFVGIISDDHFGDLVKRYEKAQTVWAGTKIVRGTGNLSQSNRSAVAVPYYETLT